MNSRLPDDVRIIDAARAVPSFDARHDVLWRRYRYSVRNANAHDVFADLFSWRIRRGELCMHSMKAAAATLVTNEQFDLNVFRKSNAQVTHARIRVFAADVHISPNCDEIFVDVTADWFVYGMMRLLTSALVDVGTKQLSVDEFVRRVHAQDRASFKSSAPANGLCLMQVAYPELVDPFIRKPNQESVQSFSH